MKKMNPTSKKELGERFTRFRTSLGKTQEELSSEMGIKQTTVSHIEKGCSALSLKHILYLKKNCSLNANWILTGIGSMKSDKDEGSAKKSCPLLDFCVSGKDPDYESFKELIVLMKLPIIRYGIFLKLKELKVLVKEDAKIILPMN